MRGRDEFVKVTINSNLAQELGCKEFAEQLVETTELLLKQALYKNRRYKNSWRKRGESGVWHNFGRKSDRIEAISDDAFNRRGTLPSGEESLCETVGDAANYSKYWVGLIRELRPDEYGAWKTKILQEFKAVAAPLLGGFDDEDDEDVEPTEQRRRVPVYDDDDDEDEVPLKTKPMKGVAFAKEGGSRPRS